MLFRMFIAGAFAFLGLSSVALGQEEMLQKVPELQLRAQRASGGAMGCGMGTIELETSSGVVSAMTSLDPIHVFGKRVKVSELLSLAKARARHVRTGEDNSMSGDVGQLMFVTLNALEIAGDPDSVSVITGLLRDKDETIRAWATIVLFRLAEKKGDLKAKIEMLVFPEIAIQSAEGRGVSAPDWIMRSN